MGGKFDLLVCEIVDDQLLGEGVLTTVADARRRLLKPDARILPRGGSLYALPVELKVPDAAGLETCDLGLFSCDQLLSLSCPLDSVKTQQLAPGQCTRLAPPMRLFDFEWATSPLDELLRSRSTERLPLTFVNCRIVRTHAPAQRQQICCLHMRVPLPCG